MAEWHKGLWNNGPNVRASATPVCAAKEKFRLHIGGEWLALCRHSGAQPNAAALSQEGEMPAFRICYGVRHPSLPPGHTSVWQQQWNPGVSPWKLWFVSFYHCGNNLLFSVTVEIQGPWPCIYLKAHQNIWNCGSPSHSLHYEFGSPLLW